MPHKNETKITSEPSDKPRIIRWPEDTTKQHAVARELAEALRAGALVALPTETVYGLAAPGLRADAVAQIFGAKGRPAHNPVILHVADAAAARALTTHWPDAAERLAAALWPGPLTLVLPRVAAVPDIVTAGGPTVALRVPSHPAFRAVLAALGEPLAAPSANRSNHISPTTAHHVDRSLGPRVQFILDAGPVTAGIESTVVDVTQSPARILRPGPISLETLRAILGADAVAEHNDAARANDAKTNSADDASATKTTLRAPGMLPRHYAPDTPAILVYTADLSLRIAAAARPIVVITCTSSGAQASHPQTATVIELPNNPTDYAREIYAALHRADEMRAATIIIEAPPDTPEWHAVTDRLRRATTS